MCVCVLCTLFFTLSFELIEQFCYMLIRVAAKQHPSQCSCVYWMRFYTEKKKENQICVFVIRKRRNVVEHTVRKNDNKYYFSFDFARLLHEAIHQFFFPFCLACFAPCSLVINIYFCLFHSEKQKITEYSFFSSLTFMTSLVIIESSHFTAFSAQFSFFYLFINLFFRRTDIAR